MKGRTSMGVLLGGLLLAGCGGEPAAGPEEAALPEVAVELGEVVMRSTIRTQALPGTVYPSDQTVIASKVMATVSRVEVSIGEPVKEDQLLVTLEAREILAQVEQAKAILAQLERNYEREKALLQQSATTAESVRTLEDEMRQARARLAEAETMESYLQVRAPYDGIVTTEGVRRGDLAQPGMALLNIEGRGHLEVYVQVPDSLMTLSYEDAVELEAGGIIFSATLSEWSPAADPSSRTRLAKLQLPADTPLRSGQYVRVNWPAEEVKSLWMPAAALARIGQLERVFLYEDGKLQLQLIKSGRRTGEYLKVLAGLNAGDRVVLSPSNQIKDGQPALVLP